MVDILVVGTTIIEWGAGPYDPDGKKIPFTVDDQGFLDDIPQGKEPHWNGSKFWLEDIVPSATDLDDAIVEVADIAAGNTEQLGGVAQQLDDIIDAIMELAELVGGNENG
jgi:hypothetical protein